MVTMTRQEESLIIAPHVLGYRPENSVVVTALAKLDESEESSRHSVGPLLVWDLDRAPLRATAAETVFEFIRDLSVTDVSIDWFGRNLEEMIDDSLNLSRLHRAALEIQDELDDMYRSSRVGFVSASMTDFNSWISVNSCPPGLGGQQVRELGLFESFDELANGQLATELIYLGSAPVAESEIGIVPRFSRGKRRLADAEYRQWLARGDQRAWKMWDRVLMRLGNILDDTELTVGDLGGSRRVGRLNASLMDPTLRDAILVYALNPYLVTFPEMTEVEVDHHLAAAGTITPTRFRMASVIRIFEVLAAYSSSDDPAPYAVLAYLHWWQDRSTTAQLYAIESLKSDPNYSLAQLIHHAITMNVPPPWHDAASGHMWATCTDDE